MQDSHGSRARSLSRSALSSAGYDVKNAFTLPTIDRLRYLESLNFTS